MHFLARCPVFHEIRKQYVDDMYEVVNEHFGQNFWSRNIKQREDLVKFILDASFFVRTEESCWKKCVREVRDNNSRHVLQNPLSQVKYLKMLSGMTK